MKCNIHNGRYVTIVSIYDFLQLVKKTFVKEEEYMLPL